MFEADYGGPTEPALTPAGLKFTGRGYVSGVGDSGVEPDG